MLLAAMCLSIAVTQEPQAVAFRIEGRSESRNMIGTREGVSGSSSSVAFVQVTASDSAGGVVLDVVVDTFHIEHAPPELAERLPADFRSLATPFRYRLFLPPATEHAVPVGPRAPAPLSHASAVLTAAYNRWPDVREDTVVSRGERESFGRSRWTTRRSYDRPTSSNDALTVRASRSVAGTGPAGGNLVGESSSEMRIVSGADGAPSEATVVGTNTISEAVVSSGVVVETTGNWRYTLTRVAAAQRPAT